MLTQIQTSIFLKSQKKHKAFTLIEILVVIAIIGILASIVLVSLSRTRNKAKDGRIISDMGQIRKAAEVWQSGNNRYTGMDADGTEIDTLIKDIENQGATVTKHIGENYYCIYAELIAEPGKVWCVDSGLNSLKLDGAPTTCSDCSDPDTCKCK